MTDTVQPDLTEEEARALLHYTKTALSADDSFDNYREKIASACEELERALNADSTEERDNE